jgi:hypothetical protein
MYRIRIVDNTSLSHAAGALHDARFGRSGVSFQTDAGAFTLSGNQWSTLDGNAVPSWYPFELTFREVLKCDVAFFEDVRFYEVANLVLSDASTLRIVTHYACDIVLKLRAVRGLLCIRP